MKALQVTRSGSPEEVPQVVDIDIPEPGPRDVRIKVNAAAPNFHDIDRCRGKLVSVPTAVVPGRRRFGLYPLWRDAAGAIHGGLLRRAADGKIRPGVGRRVPMRAAGKALEGTTHTARSATVVMVAR